MSNQIEVPAQTEQINIVSAVYHKESERFRDAWTRGREEAKTANEALDRMVVCLREEHPEWSNTKIIQKISVDHSDLEGFSETHVRRRLTNSGTLVQNNGTPDGVRKKQNIVRVKVSEAQTAFNRDLMEIRSQGFLTCQYTIKGVK